MRQLLAIVLFVCMSWIAAAGTAAAAERLTFVGVALDNETRQADRVLQDYLHRRAHVDFAPEELDYGRVIERLANWGPHEGPYLARTTPYVFLASEMLGADFEILATYVSSATGRLTYNAYLVVSRDDFPSPPTLSDVIRFVRDRKTPARFVYHNEFSTSSYLLPALLFRSRNIFHMPASTESLAAIRSERIEMNSSTELVRMVARREADLAAVWDGTKSRFATGGSGGPADALGGKVHFVRLETTLPNDLLVCSRALDPAVKERIRTAIRAMGPEEIQRGDFETWEEIREATDARVALADLRWMVRQRVHPVTVEIHLDAVPAAGPSGSRILEAARNAVRLSEAEFVLYDEDFHEHIDYRWTLKPIHDGAIELRSAIPGSDIDDQSFQISFQNGDDLMKRVSSLLHSRIHRIRSVWPYSQESPIVLRDTPDSLPSGAVVKVQSIQWLDPQKNDFRGGPVFDATIRDAGSFRYRLDPVNFPKTETGDLGFDAMSNLGYRVVLTRPVEERMIFRALTIALLGLLVLAGAGAVFDLSRRPRRSSVEAELASAPTIIDSPKKAASSLPGPGRESGPSPPREPEHWH